MDPTWLPIRACERSGVGAERGVERSDSEWSEERNGFNSERRGFHSLHHRSITSSIHANDPQYNCIFSKNSHVKHI